MKRHARVLKKTIVVRAEEEGEVKEIAKKNIGLGPK
jgi:hypothetical protein